jgi:hypothetical protein
MIVMNMENALFLGLARERDRERELEEARVQELNMRAQFRLTC